MSISKKITIEEFLKEYNQFISKLTRQQSENLSDAEILKLAMERPGHPGQHGFLLQPQYFRSDEHFAETMKALLDRLAKVKK